MTRPRSNVGDRGFLGLRSPVNIPAIDESIESQQQVRAATVLAKILVVRLSLIESSEKLPGTEEDAPS